MVKSRIVNQGDIVKINFNSKKGHEQSGYRPAVVISNNIFNEKTKMVLVCPITTNVKNFPLHIFLDERTKTKGKILCEHIRALDIYERGYNFIEKIPNDILQKVVNIIKAEIEISQ